MNNSTGFNGKQNQLEEEQSNLTYLANCHAIFYLLKKIKRVFASTEFKNNGPVLSFKRLSDVGMVLDCEQSPIFLFQNTVDREHECGESSEATRNEGGNPSKEKIRDCDGICDLAICRFTCHG